MKKLIALVLALCVMMAAVAAVAEVRSYEITGVKTADGMILGLVYDDNGEATVVATDAEGNVVVTDAEIPYAVLTIDDEAMTVVYADAETEEAGTVEIVERTEEVATLQITLEDGNTFVMYYADDALTMMDEGGNAIVFTRVAE